MINAINEYKVSSHSVMGIGMSIVLGSLTAFALAFAVSVMPFKNVDTTLASRAQMMPKPAALKPSSEPRHQSQRPA